MAKTKPRSKSSKDQHESPADVAKHIWLAGLGAYGKAYDEAVSRYEKASKDTPKLFKDLVAKGEKLESGTKEKSTDNTLTRARADIEERIAAVKENLGFGNLFGQQQEDDISRIEHKLDELNRKVDALAKAIGEKSAPKARAKAKASPKAKAKKATARPNTKPKAKAKAKTSRRS